MSPTPSSMVHTQVLHHSQCWRQGHMSRWSHQAPRGCSWAALNIFSCLSPDDTLMMAHQHDGDPGRCPSFKPRVYSRHIQGEISQEIITEAHTWALGGVNPEGLSFCCKFWRSGERITNVSLVLLKSSKTELSLSITFRNMNDIER